MCTLQLCHKMVHTMCGILRAGMSRLRTESCRQFQQKTNSTNDSSKNRTTNITSLVEYSVGWLVSSSLNTFYQIVGKVIITDASFGFYPITH